MRDVAGRADRRVLAEHLGHFGAAFVAGFRKKVFD